jgi:hypothetical protein
VQECLIVTGGSVRTGPSDQAVDLAEGDSAHFGAACPHVYRGLGPHNRALLLMLHPALPALPASPERR